MGQHTQTRHSPPTYPHTRMQSQWRYSHLNYIVCTISVYLLMPALNHKVLCMYLDFYLLSITSHKPNNTCLLAMGQSYGDQNTQESLETSQPMTKTTQSVWFALITESQDLVSNVLLSFVCRNLKLQLGPPPQQNDNVDNENWRHKRDHLLATS